MKARLFLLSAASLLLFASCVRDLNGIEGGTCTASITVGPEDARTRSSAGSTDAELEAFENKITDLTLFRFLVDGSAETLEEAVYYDLSSGSGTTRTVTMNVKKGVNYKFYGLLNGGDQSGELSVGDDPSGLQNIILTGITMSTMKTDGIPMVNCTGVSANFSASTSVTIPMTRLVARWDFKIDKSNLSHTSFSMPQLRLCQSPNRTLPFVSANAATSSSHVQDGDATTANDLNIISSGGTATFYVLENACGELLPSNTDPWAKVPDSGTSVDGYYPTYIEMTGQLVDKPGGLQRTSYYRMYLGENTTTNFDVERGTHYTLTFKPTEEVITEDICDEWKCEFVSSTDNRIFHFDSSVYFLNYGNGYKKSFSVNTNGDYDIFYSIGTSSAGLNISESSQYFSASAPSTGSSVKKVTVTAYFWDDTIADRCTVYICPPAAEAQPVGLYINTNSISVEDNQFSWFHDPDCPNDHHYHDVSKCNYNHDNSVASDYMDITECPYYYYDDSNCNNKILDEAGAVNGESEFTAELVTDYYVDSNGDLIRGTIIDSGVSFYDIALGTRDDPDYYLYRNHQGTFTGVASSHFSVSSSGELSWGTQFQEPKCQYWTICVGHDGNTYRYLVPLGARNNSYLNDTFESTPSISFDNTGNGIRTFVVTGNTGDSASEFYIFSRGVTFMNNSRDYNNRFLSGDTITASVDEDFTEATVPVYILNSTGGIVWKGKFYTDSYNVNIFHSGTTCMFNIFSGFNNNMLSFTVSDIQGFNSAGTQVLTMSDCTITKIYDYVSISSSKIKTSSVLHIWGYVGEDKQIKIEYNLSDKSYVVY